MSSHSSNVEMMIIKLLRSVQGSFLLVFVKVLLPLRDRGTNFTDAQEQTNFSFEK